MSVSKEAIEAGLRITLSSVNMPAGECLHETDVREILEAALPFLPIAVEWKEVWRPIASAPQNGKIVMLAWSPDDWTTGQGFYRDGKWVAVGTFYNHSAGKPPYEFRQITVAPVLWADIGSPSSPGQDGGQEVDGKRVERWRRASIALGSWMAAALDNDEVCEAMKADIREWFSASEPFEGMADDGPLTISYPVHEIAHNLLLAHTGSEGGSPTVNWYGLRSEIADAIAAALDKQRRLDTQPASTALVERLTDEQLRDIADSKDTATCRARLLAALSASTSREGESRG